MLSKRMLSALCALLMLGAAQPALADGEADAVTITLADDGVLADGQAVPEGDDTAPVYTAHDVVYYEAGHDFTYGEGTEADEHTAEEAAEHTVVHIAAPGTYVLRGTLDRGQIAVDLGEDAQDDPDAVVTLILDGADVTCTVAPAVIFYNVYECDQTGDQGAEPDLSGAGARVVIADGSENHIAGSYVARIYKSYTLSEDGKSVTDSKKLHKYDGAFYSKMSMTVAGGDEGTGVLEITAENEGLDTEMHLAVDGGSIRIASGNDGINCNEDGVSVITVNGGDVHITVTGQTGEGDGIDSNGWLVINGGCVTAMACSDSGDAGIDAENAVCLNGGQVIATGNMLDPVTVNGPCCALFTFPRRQAGGTRYALTGQDGAEIMAFMAENDFTYLLMTSPALTEGDGYSLYAGEQQLALTAGGMGMDGPGMFPGGMGGMKPGEAPDGMEPGEAPEPPEGTEPGEAPELPEGMEPGDAPEPPEGMQPGDAPEPPEGMQPGDAPEPPEGMEPGEAPEMPQADSDAGEASVLFSLTPGLNRFSVSA